MSNNEQNPPPYRCPECDWQDGGDNEMDSFAAIKNLDQRVAPGEFVPVGKCPDCGALIPVADKDVPEYTLDHAARIMGERGWLVLKPDLTTKTNIQVSVDGGVCFYPAICGVRIVYDNVVIAESDGRNELHVNATSEGVISDVWHVSAHDAPGVDHHIGTESILLDDYVQRVLK